MEKEKLQITLLENGIATKAMTQPVKNLEKTINSLKTGRSIVIETREELASFSSQTNENGGRYTNNMPVYVPPVLLGLAFNVGKAFLRYCSRKASELNPFILEQRENWKRKSKEVKKMRNRKENGTILGPLIPFSA